MPSVSLPDAVERIVREIETGMDAANLLEVYNSLLPGDPEAAAKADRDPAELIRPLVAYVRSGLPIDALIEAWGVVFVDHRRVRYEEEDDRIHYRESRKSVPTE